jgi:hypothetical protein
MPHVVKQSRKFGMELKGVHAVKLPRMGLCKRILLWFVSSQWGGIQWF